MSPNGPDIQAMSMANVRQLKLLASYHYFADENIGELMDQTFAGFEVKLFADSGAFSSWTQGKRIEVTDYAAWLRRWSKHFTCAAALDVIGDPDASYTQMRELRSMIDPSLEILPTYHFSGAKSFDPLKRYIDEGHTYIALGGLVGSKCRSLTDAWIARCFQLGGSSVRFHGFGVTAWSTLKKFPWFSVDSSTWTSGFRYGRLALFDPRTGTWTKIMMSRPASILGAGPLLKIYGLTPEEVRGDRGSLNRAKICRAATQSWSLASAWLDRFHKKKIDIFLGISATASSNTSGASISQAYGR